MTDLEITRACAEAMELPVIVLDIADGLKIVHDGISYGKYDPLHDDAQAMALVKTFRAWIGCDRGLWSVSLDYSENYEQPFFDGRSNVDLNRAICECVAKMREGK